MQELHQHVARLLGQVGLGQVGAREVELQANPVSFLAPHHHLICQICQICQTYQVWRFTKMQSGGAKALKVSGQNV